MMTDDNDGQMIFGDLVGLKLPDICLTDEEKPRKNHTQETCPDRGSNPGPLCDRHACCGLVHSGGLDFVIEYRSHCIYLMRGRYPWNLIAELTSGGKPQYTVTTSAYTLVISLLAGSEIRDMYVHLTSIVKEGRKEQ